MSITLFLLLMGSYINLFIVPFFCYVVTMVFLMLEEYIYMWFFDYLGFLFSLSFPYLVHLYSLQNILFLFHLF